MDEFVDSGNGGLYLPGAITFGPDNHLYVTSQVTETTSAVLRFNGTTGDSMGTFVDAGSGGLDDPRGLVFGYKRQPARGRTGRKCDPRVSRLGRRLPR